MAGQTVPNAVIAQGRVRVDGVCVHVDGDASWWWTSTASFEADASVFVALVPARLLDSRRPESPTVDGLFEGGWGVGGGLAVRSCRWWVGVVCRCGCGAVVLNVTVTDAQGPGFVTVYPCGAVRPLASSLNFVAGQTVANAVVAKPGADGTVALYNDRGSAHLVVDVAGWMPPGTSVVDVGAGTSHSLALRSDGSVFAWGDNHAGQLGDGGATLGTSVPQQVLGLGPGSAVSAVSAGDADNLALVADGTVLSWGGNVYGQLGNGTDDLTSDVPVQVSGLGPGSGVVQIATAGSTGLASSETAPSWRGVTTPWGSSGTTATKRSRASLCRCPGSDPAAASWRSVPDQRARSR